MAPQSRKEQREAAKLHARQRAERDQATIRRIEGHLDELDAGTFVGHPGSWLLRDIAATEAYQRGDAAVRALGQRAAEVVARFEQDEAYQQRCEAMGKSALMPFTEGN